MIAIHEKRYMIHDTVIDETAMLGIIVLFT